MKLTKNFATLALSAAMASPLIVLSTPVQAGASADVTMSNMYLWRGQNLTPDGASVSGTLMYSHDSGAYGGMWTSTETEGHETDLFIGYAGAVGDFGYDISFLEYMYPEEETDAGAQLDIEESDLSEFVLGLSYGDFGFTAYINAGSGSDDKYYTLSYGMGAFSATVGLWDLEDDAADSYSHVTLGYAATDELSFGVSFAQSDLDTPSVEEDPLFQVSYTKAFDL